MIAALLAIVLLLGAAPPRLGMDYVNPASGLTGCPPWTWLQPTCYDNASLTPSHLSPKALLAQDLAFIQANRLGTFTRVWVSLDQMMVWDAATGYISYDRGALANLDDAIGQFAAAGMTLDLVLLTSSNQNGFHPEALDGNHGVMRTGYRTAVYDLMAHISTLTGHGAVVTADLLNEGYYQLERYYSDPTHLGRWAFKEPVGTPLTACAVPGNAICTGRSDGHGCITGSGTVDNSCIDANVIWPWVRDLYSAAHAAYPSVAYTVSDTGRLLGAGQAHWLAFYPVDTYDAHLYADDPAGQAGRWATGLTLPKPWFAGEVGCASGHTACTYDGTAALPVDSWWLANLPADSATAVLVEDRRAVWTYPYIGSGIVPTLSLLGRLLAGPR